MSFEIKCTCTGGGKACLRIKNSFLLLKHSKRIKSCLFAVSYRRIYKNSGVTPRWACFQVGVLKYSCSRHVMETGDKRRPDQTPTQSFSGEIGLHSLPTVQSDLPKKRLRGRLRPDGPTSFPGLFPSSWGRSSLVAC